MLSSLLALTTGLGIGLFAQEQLLAILIAIAILGLYWFTGAIGTRLAASSQIDSFSPPGSIFKTEYEEIEFIDDQERLQKKKTFSRAISYISGVALGLLVTPLLTMT
ncbi:MAG TPA: hypothetical protein DCQ47_02675 [Gammaproteobacteria bacterium]|nr:hypothetical protein [Gammaproteobacteria bacterium]